MMRLKLTGNFFVFANLVLAFLASCTKNPEKTEVNYQNDLIVGLASPIQLQPDTTVVNIEDYIIEYSSIDSIVEPEGLQLKQKGNLLYLTGIIPNLLANLSLWKDGIHYDILLEKSAKIPYTFKYEGEASDVKIKGEFNAWDPNNTILFKNNDNIYETTLLLSPGNYQYLFVIDGVEIRDPLNQDSISNGMGGWNSLIQLTKPDKKQLPQISTDSFSDKSINFSLSNPADKILAYWQNQLLSEKQITLEESIINIDLPKSAGNIKRSFVRVWAYNKEGVSNDVLIPLEYGKVLNDHSLIERQDKEANILYFLMIDRFNNGNTNNDKKVDDAGIHPKANYYGGDLKGVTNKIDDGYFDSLGITTIWLSPIAQNPDGAFGKYPNPKTTFSGYHGYWPISSSAIDYRFGNDEELHELLNKAHAKGMNVILDYVANHVHEQHPVYQNNNDWATPLYLPDGTLNTERWDDHRLTTWFDTFLPTLDLSRPEVVDPMTDSALYWLKKYDFDGFRHDATKHIPELFWRELTKKTKKQVIIPNEKTVLQIGETYGSRELINSYINSGMLDGQFDFNLYDDAVQTFANPETSFERLTNSINESISYYGDHNLMGNITGNQDRARFISYADGSVRFDEDTKLAGWTRQIDVKDTAAYKKLNMLTAFMMSIPGIPVIYYGDEIGSPGGNDPDNRRMMRFDDVNKYEKQSRNITTKLINARKENLALLYGNFEILQTSKDVLVLKRKYFDNEIIIVFNKSDQVKQLEIPIDLQPKASTLFGNKWNDNILTLPANTFDFIKQ